MSVIYCELCHQNKDTDFVGCEVVTLASRGQKKELICGDCFENLEEHTQEGKPFDVMHEGKPYGVSAKRWASFEAFYRSWGVFEKVGKDYDGEPLKRGSVGLTKEAAEIEAAEMTAEDEDESGTVYEARRICDT